MFARGQNPWELAWRKPVKLEPMPPITTSWQCLTAPPFPWDCVIGSERESNPWSEDWSHWLLSRQNKHCELGPNYWSLVNNGLFELLRTGLQTFLSHRLKLRKVQFKFEVGRNSSQIDFERPSTQHRTISKWTERTWTSPSKPFAYPNAKLNLKQGYRLTVRYGWFVVTYC